MGILEIVVFLVIGAVAGWAASQFFKGRKKMGLITNLLVGVAGAFIGGFLFSIIPGISVGGGLVGTFIAAFVGSIILLAVLRAVAR